MKKAILTNVFALFKFNSVIVCVLLLLWNTCLLAQTETTTKKRPFISAGITLNSIGFPFLSKPNHLGFNVGLDYQLNQSTLNALYLTSSLHFVRFKYWQDLVYLNTGLEYQRKIGKLFFSGTLGINAYLGFPSGKEFEFVAGKYNAINKVYLRFGPDIKLGIGYTNSNFKLGISYGMSLQYPFIKNKVPVLPNGIIAIKYSFKLKLRK